MQRQGSETLLITASRIRCHVKPPKSLLWSKAISRGSWSESYTCSTSSIHLFFFLLSNGYQPGPVETRRLSFLWWEIESHHPREEHRRVSLCGRSLAGWLETADPEVAPRAVIPHLLFVLSQEVCVFDVPKLSLLSCAVLILVKGLSGL